jgi:hypothetical protein
MNAATYDDDRFPLDSIDEPVLWRDGSSQVARQFVFQRLRFSHPMKWIRDHLLQEAFEPRVHWRVCFAPIDPIRFRLFEKAELPHSRAGAHHVGQPWRDSALTV